MTLATEEIVALAGVSVMVIAVPLLTTLKPCKSWMTLREPLTSLYAAVKSVSTWVLAAELVVAVLA
jgi:hypothetical protein